MRIFAFLLVFFCFLSFSMITSDSSRSERINDYKTLAAAFKKPPAEYSTAPFWVWNDRVTKEKIDTQLAEFKGQKINSVIIHCRPGLITEYLSDEWFELNNYALEKAKSMDMKVWLYDENCFPSGYGGGHVQREMPESYIQGQGLEMMRAGQLTTDNTQNIFIILEREGDLFNDITARADDKIGEEGDYFLFKKTFYKVAQRETGYPYPDLLVPGVTEKFIEVTMPGYEKTFGEEFGKNILGIFTDEPHIQPPGKGKTDVRWTPTLFSDFKERWGYSLVKHLPSLFEEIGDYKRVRHNYYLLLIELFVERWSKPWYEYTEANNLNWTGHYWEHGWPSPQHAGDNMVLYAYHQTPGIDMLFNTNGTGQFGDIFLGRELLSSANQFGRHRTLSETYGASGWDLDFEALKRLGDWEYAAGVNLMNQHLAYMTTKGSRKRDFPQSISWHASWWEQYHHLANHHARLSVALSSGQNINKTILIEPTTSTWMYYTPQKGEKSKEYGKDFKELVEELEKFKIEFDLGSEMVMKDFCTIDNGKFRIQQRIYDNVILGPHMESINESTLKLLEEYFRHGGKVFYFDKLPQYVDAQKSEKLEKLVAENHSKWVKLDSKNIKSWMDQFKADDFSVTTVSENLFHQRRYMNDGQLLFFTNFSQDKTEELDFSVKGKSVSLFDSFTGKVYNFPATDKGERQQVSCTLPPGNSRLFYVHNSVVKNPLFPENPASFQPIKTGGTTVRPLKDNVLVLDYCDVKVGGKEFNDINYLHATDSIFKLHGFRKSDIDHNPWNFSVQYKTERLDKKFGEGTGFDAVFPFEIASDYGLKGIQIGVDYGRLYKVTVNGEPVSINTDAWYFDNSIDVYDVPASVLKHGRNTIRMSVHPMDILAEMERIFVLGDFDLKPVEKGFAITERGDYQLGSWPEQGLSFYPEKVGYEKSFKLDKKQPVKIVLNEWEGTVAAVKVNGKEAGIIGWHPYELDISEQVKSGENMVEVVVYGSPFNLLGPHYYEPPKGIATPWSWNRAPENQPAGDEYIFLDYGLKEDFSVMVSN